MAHPRILYVAHKFDYGDPALGTGFEHENFFKTLRAMGLPLIYFDIGMHRDIGREAMNRLLVEVARAERPDVMFTVLFKDELDPAAVREVSGETDTVTFNWFCDDHWRYDDYSKHWAPCFNAVSTTARSALPKYERDGIENVIKTQWAANHFHYRPPEGTEPGEGRDHGLTFVGRVYGSRQGVLGRIRRAGLPIETWGPGTDNGKVEQSGMVEIFGRSKINLNLVQSSVPPNTLPVKAKRAVAKAMNRTGLKPMYRGLDRALRGRDRGKLFEREQHTTGTEQIKGRNFEVPACGGFLLSGYAEELELYFDIGSELVCFSDTDDLIDKARHYIEHEDERVAIARAGYERTVRQHTYVHRFVEIFERLGFQLGDPAPLLRPASTLGDVLEITADTDPVRR